MKRKLYLFSMAPRLSAYSALAFILGVFILGGDAAAKSKARGYESGGPVDARKVLPTALRKGKHYQVLDDAFSYGLTNRYTLTSPFGSFRAIGEEGVRIRALEIEAIAVLEKVEKSTEFAAGVKSAASGPFKFAKNLILHPADTVSGIPKGMGRWGLRVKEMVTGTRGEAEESVAKELIGFSAAKRKLAYDLNVDVYSSNDALQKRLNGVAWAKYSGGATVAIGTMAISGAAGLVVRGTQFGGQMNGLLRDNAPEDLRRLNRTALAQMGVGEALSEQFLQNRWFSPRNETILIQALGKMQTVKHRRAFIRAANGWASDTQEAFEYQQLAEMLRAYHATVKPLQALRVSAQGMVVGVNTDGVLIAPLPYDNLHWTKAAVAVATHLKKESGRASGVEWWIAGRATPRCKQELEARGFVVKENVRGKLLHS